MKRWAAAHPDQVKQHAAATRARYSAERKAELDEYARGYRLANQQAIRDAARKRKRASRDLRRADRRIKICSLPGCGKPIPTATRSDRKYCSRECGRRGTNSQWSQRNPLKRTLIQQTRRARRLEMSLAAFTSDQALERMSMFAFRCWMCGDEGRTLDHVKPLSAGGAHVLANLRPACASCNSRKGPKWFGVAGLDRFRRPS